LPRTASRFAGKDDPQERCHALLRSRMSLQPRDARFFASCVDGVDNLNEIDETHYTG
jgi:hypothetical protein